MTTAPNNLTVPPTVPTSDDSVDYLTCYAARSGYGPCPAGIDPQIWRAYGPRYPGGHKRWRDQQAEREAARSQAALRKAVGP